MPRPPRYHAPGSVYHVMARGNGGQNIVSRSAGWQALLDVVAQVKATSDFKLYAYCLMTNHFHAFIRVGIDPLSHFMQRIQSTWAKRFNVANHRFGHVFQARFKSKDCGDDTEYCRWLLRYIHMNPVNAGMTKLPEEWAWSSYRQFLGLCDGIADIGWPLSLFENRLSSFAEFVLQGEGDSREPKEMEDSQIRPQAPVKQESAPAEPPPFERLAKQAAAESGISVETLLGPARARVVCAARRRLVATAMTAGYRGSFLAAKFGVTTTAISRMMRGIGRSPGSEEKVP